MVGTSALTSGTEAATHGAATGTASRTTSGPTTCHSRRGAVLRRTTVSRSRSMLRTSDGTRRTVVGIALIPRTAVVVVVVILLPGRAAVQVVVRPVWVVRLPKDNSGANDDARGVVVVLVVVFHTTRTAFDRAAFTAVEVDIPLGLLIHAHMVVHVHGDLGRGDGGGGLRLLLRRGRNGRILFGGRHVVPLALGRFGLGALAFALANRNPPLELLVLALEPPLEGRLLPAGRRGRRRGRGRLLRGGCVADDALQGLVAVKCSEQKTPGDAKRNHHQKGVLSNLFDERGHWPPPILNGLTWLSSC